MSFRTFSMWILAAAAGAAVACAGGNGSGSSTTAPSGSGSSAGSGSSTPIITITGQTSPFFTPNPASFGGQSVVFKNSDSVTHHVVLNDGSVDTGDIAPGATSRAVLMPSGGTNYHCMIHPGMIGAVDAAGGAAAPPCDGQYCTGY